MALVYVSTCAGGNHHLFQDDVTLKRVVFSTEELREEHLGRDQRDSVINQLPPAVRTEIVRRDPQAEPGATRQ